jgi:hypothetical protein
MIFAMLNDAFSEQWRLIRGSVAEQRAAGWVMDDIKPQARCQLHQTSCPPPAPETSPRW